MNEFLIPTLTFVAVTSLGGAAVTAYAARRAFIRNRLRFSAQQPQNAADQDQSSGATSIVAALGRRLSSGKPSARLQQDLARAGFHSPSAAATYMGSKFIMLGLGLASAVVAVLQVNLGVLLDVCVVAVCGGVMFFVPNFVVDGQRRRRSREVRENLPDVVDLLEVCVSSGMSLDMAWNIVADDVRGVSPTLADEMALTNLEIHLGAPRVRAMRHLAERTGVAEIGSLVAVLVQSERFGTSISEALRAFATYMREVRSNRAQEAAEGMAVKLLFPMVLCIFPAVLVVLAGPALIQVAKHLFDVKV